MQKSNGIISDFEELFKLKEFSEKKEKVPYENTYEQIVRSIKIEYEATIDKKVKRWVNISHVLYFKNVLPVKYYLQAKMLFRDGFYESAITMSRSICEMICYERLVKRPHPFGTLNELELENFRTLVKFLAIQKKIEKTVFEVQVLNKLSSAIDKNFLKSSYNLDVVDRQYIFKIENGKTAKNLNHFFKIFESVAYKDLDTFSNDSFNLINKVYDIGNSYIHAKKRLFTSEKDAAQCLNMLCQVLSELYGVQGIKINQTVKSGYTDFPDICTGINFSIEVFATPEDALRGYLNLPTPKQIDKLVSIKGEWSGEWECNQIKHKKGTLSFFGDAEFFQGNIKYLNKENQEVMDPLEIMLFGNYFRIRSFDAKTSKHNKNKHIHFELEFFSKTTLIGRNLIEGGNVIFNNYREIFHE